jgi:hypothetical protein
VCVLADIKRVIIVDEVEAADLKKRDDGENEKCDGDQKVRISGRRSGWSCFGVLQQ